MKKIHYLKNERKRFAITNKMFLSLFLTGTIIEFSQVGSGFIDGLVISRFLGPEAMAAEGIVHPIYSILGIISGLLAVGMQVRCAHEIGRGNKKEYSRFVSSTLCVGAVASVSITILFLIFARPISVFLGASHNAADLLDLASTYLTGVTLGAPPLIMTAILAPVLQLDTGRKTIQIGALIEAVADVILDLVAVKIGLGVFGVGLATAIASYLNLLFQCTFFFKKDRAFHFVKPSMSFKEFGRMLINGSEKAVKRIANTLRPIILNTVIIAYGGVTAMSILSIRNNFSNFIEIFGAGIASAVALLTGIYYGEINIEGIKAVNKFEHKIIICAPGIITILVFVFAPQIASLYIPKEGEAFSLVVFAIRMLALEIPLGALIESRIRYLQAVYKKHNANVLSMATRLVFIVISALVMGLLFGVEGILVCFLFSDILALVSIYIYYAIKCRNIKVKRKDFLNLPDSFYLHPGDVISLDVRNLEDATIVSEQIMLFCSGHKIHPKIAYYAALVFEELSINVIKHGFPKNSSSSPIIDIRVVIADNSLIIRMRDNCPSYDVVKEIAKVNEDGSDIIHNIGTRIASKLASDIEYFDTFDTNSLIIRFDLSEPPQAIKDGGFC